MINWGAVPASSTLPFFFDTFAGSTGAPITMSGFATSDILVYKGTSMTQRASTAGFALIDTDGIDLDGITGIQGFSIDLSDNTDAGFYAVGSFYTVVISTVTVDSQTMSFIAGTFRIVAAEAVAGKPKVDVDAFGGTAGTFSSGIPEVKINNIAANAITATSIASNALTAAKIATDAIGAAQLASDAVTEIQSGLATSSALLTVAGYIDTEVASILNYVSVAGVVVATNNDKTGYALTSGERNSVADALLNRDMSAVTVTNSRSPINALRTLRNKVDVPNGTVYAEDDTTAAWTFTTTTSAAADPITVVDPT